MGNRPPLSLARLIRNLKKEGNAEKLVVCVGTVTNDLRIFDVPKFTLCALRVTEKARERILKAGGEISPSTSWPSVLPLARTLFSSRVPARPVWHRGTSERRASPAATSSRSSGPRDASSSLLVAAGSPGVTRSSPDELCSFDGLWRLISRFCEDAKYLELFH